VGVGLAHAEDRPPADRAVAARGRHALARPHRLRVLDHHRLAAADAVGLDVEFVFEIQFFRFVIIVVHRQQLVARFSLMDRTYLRLLYPIPLPLR
jgi:hypothetical protein